MVCGIRFLSTAEGGRKGPVTSDYRPNCSFGEAAKGNRVYHDVRFFFIDGDGTLKDGVLWVPPGGSARAQAFPLAPSYLRPIVHEGMAFELCEGEKVVGRATVEAVVDPGSEYDLG